MMVMFFKTDGSTQRRGFLVQAAAEAVEIGQEASSSRLILDVDRDQNLVLASGPAVSLLVFSPLYTLTVTPRIQVTSDTLSASSVVRAARSWG